MSTLLQNYGLDKLTTDEMRHLAHELWDTADHVENGDDLTDEQRSELRRRLAAHRADPSASLTWEQVEAELWGTLS